MLDQAFSSGTLVDPSTSQGSLDLFRAIASLCGSTRSDLGERGANLAEQVGEYDHYVFVLVDGLGMNQATRFPNGGFFQTTMSGELRSVFPSATAVALTSLATCESPAVHGVTGWHTYYPEYRRVMTPLLFTERGTSYPGEELGLDVDDLVNGSVEVSAFQHRACAYLPDFITKGYAVWARGGTEMVGFDSHDTLLRLVTSRLRTADEPTYTYIYLLTVDKYCHIHGTTSEQVAAEVAEIDTLLVRMREALPDGVRLIASADHGLVDVEDNLRFVLHDDDELCRHLVTGPTGESTAPVFHVKPGADAAFREAFAAHPASRYFELHTPAELFKRGLYGNGPLSETATLHLGEYVGIAERVALLQYAPPGITPLHHVGVHGGLRPAEVMVPLFLA